MPKKGGKRKGAGRPPGAATKKTREIAEKAIKDGITPLEVILKAMHHEVEKQERVPRDDQDWKEAAGYAQLAAPYCHPRLSAVAHTGKDDGPIEISDVSSLDVARRYAFVLRDAAERQEQVQH